MSDPQCAVEYCCCGHHATSHSDGVGRCMIHAPRSAGSTPCGCKVFRSRAKRGRPATAQPVSDRVPVYLSRAELMAARALVERELATHADSETHERYVALSDMLAAALGGVA